MAYGETYEEFVEKFKPKRTTDDCYTPPLVYEAVKDWAVREYGLEGARIVRPFWPGADYKNEGYSGNCVVIDNPPFSILAEVRKFYNKNDIRFFLFTPNLSLFSNYDEKTNFIVVGHTTTFENGARVNISFITNMGDAFIRTAPELRKSIIDADKLSKASAKKIFPKYRYPANVISAALLGKIGGVPLKFQKNDCSFIRKLDYQRERGKAIFGSGFLISDEKAAEVRAAEMRAAESVIEWTISDREREIIRGLGGKRL